MNSKNFSNKKGAIVPIQSYLVYPQVGEKQVLINQLNQFSECEVLESTNEDVVILVTDTQDDKEENLLQENLNAITQISGMALVYAHNETDK